MADLPSAPVNARAVGDDGKATADLIRWIRLLEAKIKELEARIAALEP
jgi:hypothetical protein